jgi:hypothetical protein
MSEAVTVLDFEDSGIIPDRPTLYEVKSFSTESPEIYIDVATGTYIVGIDAFYAHIDAGGHPADLRPLHDLLISKNGTRPESPLNFRQETDQFTKHKAINNGKFLLSIVKAAKPNQTYTERMMDRAWRLGLNFSPHQIRAKSAFGTVTAYQEALGENVMHYRSRFADMTLKDLIRHIRRVGLDEGKKPTLEILTERVSERGLDEPSPKMIRSILADHGLNFFDLYERAGYQETTHSWSNNQFERWGVNYMWANEGRVPSNYAMNDLSRANLGPSSHGAINRYGSLGLFQDTLLEKFQANFETHAEALYDEVDTGRLPLYLFDEIDSEWQLLKRYFQYKIVDSTGLAQGKEDSVAMARLLSDGDEDTFGQHYPANYLLEMKSKAESLGLFSAVWPNASGLYRLEVRKSTATVFIPTTDILSKISSHNYPNVSLDFFEKRRNVKVLGAIGIPMLITQPFDMREVEELWGAGVKVPLDLMPSRYWHLADPAIINEQPLHDSILPFSEEDLGSDF